MPGTMENKPISSEKNECIFTSFFPPFFLSPILPSSTHSIILFRESCRSVTLTQLMQRCIKNDFLPEEALHVAMLRSHKNTRPTGKGKCDHKKGKTIPYKDAISQTKKMLQRLDKMWNDVDVKCKALFL